MAWFTMVNLSLSPKLQNGGRYTKEIPQNEHWQRKFEEMEKEIEESKVKAQKRDEEIQKLQTTVEKHVKLAAEVEERVRCHPFLYLSPNNVNYNFGHFN